MRLDGVTLSPTERYVLSLILEKYRYRPRKLSMRDVWPHSWRDIIGPLKDKLATKPPPGPVLLSDVVKSTTSLGKNQKIILRHLIENTSASVDELAGQIGAADEDGGPLSLNKCIASCICHLRKKRLKPEWTIITTPDRRRRLTNLGSTARRG